MQDIETMVELEDLIKITKVIKKDGQLTNLFYSTYQYLQG